VLAERLRKANEQLDAAAPAPSAGAASSVAAAAAGPAPASAPSGQGQGAATAATNGAGPSTTAATGKAKVQDALLSFFENLYTVKAMTRFSVAILGCPVEAEGPGIVDQVRAGDVKAVIVRADRPALLRIVAREAGCFTLDVLTPESGPRRRCGPEPIRPGDDVTLRLCGGSATLRSGDRTLYLEPG
jgi:hypothetical protein